jgi:hypothetical protein
MMSVGGEAAPGRGKGGDDVSWADANLIGPKNEKKSTRSIQLLQMDGEDLKQWWINLIFLIYICKWDLFLFISSCRTHRWKLNFKWILYEWDKSFKIVLLYKMTWQIMLDGCWYGMTWLNADVDTLHAKKMVKYSTKSQ